MTSTLILHCAQAREAEERERAGKLKGLESADKRAMRTDQEGVSQSRFKSSHAVSPEQALPRTLRFWPSKGSEPLTRVYSMTPRLQTSTSGPSYFLPTNTARRTVTYAT